MFTLEGTHLSLVGQKLVSMPNFKDKEHAGRKLTETITSLDLSVNKLRTLENVSDFRRLNTLVLDHNDLDADTFKNLNPKMRTVTTLWINHNNVSDLKSIIDYLLDAFPNLTYLSLLYNPCCPNNFIQTQLTAYKEYRFYVLSRMPKLETLDATPVSDHERLQVRRKRELIVPLPLPNAVISPLTKARVGFKAAKQGHLMLLKEDVQGIQKWQPSWFVLGEKNLLRYSSPEHPKPDKVIILDAFKVGEEQDTEVLDKIEDDKYALFLKLEKQAKKIHLVAQSKQELDSWLEVIREQSTLPDDAAKKYAFPKKEEDEIEKLKRQTSRRINKLSLSLGSFSIDPQQIQLTMVLGHGAFGTVYRGICRKKQVAVKVLHNQELDAEALDEFLNEIEIMSKIHHPQVVMFMGACIRPGSLMIVTELMQTDLQEFLLDTKRKLSLLTRLNLAKDSALGLNWLHCSDPMILHRDVKPKNFLIDDNLRLVVSDFGFAENLTRGDSTFDERGTFKGSLYYTAPEIIRGATFNEKSDVYSWGIVLWFIYERKEPYEELAEEETGPVIRKLVWENYRPQISDHCPPDLKNLIESCWTDNQEKRPSFEEIIQTLEEIIVGVAISDPVGRSFWKEKFLGKSKVHWSSFWTPLSNKYLRVRPGDDMIIKTLLAQKNSGERFEEDMLVDLESFGNLLGWFGPLSDPSIYDMMYQIKEILREKWFHGPLNLNDSIVKLTDQPPGTFLVRFSSSRRGDYAIAYVDKDGEINHQAIERVIQANIPGKPRFVKIEYHCMIGRERKKYLSLKELVKDQPFLKSACIGSPYAIFFNSTPHRKTRTSSEDGIQTPPMGSPRNSPPRNSPPRDRRDIPYRKLNK